VNIVVYYLKCKHCGVLSFQAENGRTVRNYCHKGEVELMALQQWFPKCGAPPPGGGGARDPQRGCKWCETILFTKKK
jgi:hypothetical protein